jgi:hypothetical protein
MRAEEADRASGGHLTAFPGRQEIGEERNAGHQSRQPDEHEAGRADRLGDVEHHERPHSFEDLVVASQVTQVDPGCEHGAALETAPRAHRTVHNDVDADQHRRREHREPDQPDGFPEVLRAIVMLRLVLVLVAHGSQEQ